MRIKESSRSGLFLLELMISIVFFMIAAAVCVQIFVKAHVISEQAGHLDMAVSLASSLAEECEDTIDGSQTWYYDSDGEICEKESAVYQADVQVTDDHHMKHMEISISLNDKAQEEIYHLEMDVYVCTETGGQS